MQVSSIGEEATYFAVVQEILELNYYDFKQTVFYCDWAKIGDKQNGFVLTKNEPYIC